MDVDFINQFNFAIKKHSKIFICKKTKFNISFFKLMLKNGLILAFYQYKYLRNKLCVFLKFIDKKPLVTKLKKEHRNNYLNSIKVLKGVESNIFFLISSNLGGFLLVSHKRYNFITWYTKVGGKILLRITL
jgi:ribosomal protein S8